MQYVGAPLAAERGCRRQNWFPYLLQPPTIAIGVFFSRKLDISHVIPVSSFFVSFVYRLFFGLFIFAGLSRGHLVTVEDRVKERSMY